jgi:hypothetical protein
MAEPVAEEMDVEEDMEMTEEEVWMLLLVSTTPFVGRRVSGAVALLSSSG